MRKLLVGLLTTAALAAAAAQASPAHAACSNWRPDIDNYIYQGNGWQGVFRYGWPRAGYWNAYLWHPNTQYQLDGDVMFSSWSKDLVRFTITWPNGSGGVYTGSIDANGFVSGYATDRWTGAWTTWRLRDVATCAG